MSQGYGGKAVFLDRDGVINKAYISEGKPFPPQSLKDLEILPQVDNALNALASEGWYLFVITNQPDVARGKKKQADVESINKHIMEKLPLTEIFTCYHDDFHHCECRKPAPGFLQLAAERYELDLKLCYMIGDRWRDIEAGENAGVKTIFINYNYNEKQPEHYDYCVANLAEASKKILEGSTI